MPNPDPTREQRIRQLIRRGIMPSEAERIVEKAEGGLEPLAILEEQSPEFQAQRAVAWWAYQAAVPHRLKRLLSARKHGGKGV